MSRQLLRVAAEFETATILDRPNRFVLDVESEEGHTEQVHIPNTGSWNVTQPGREVILEYVGGEHRKTDYDARFVNADGVWVSVDSTFANTVFEKALQEELLPAFSGYQLRGREPTLPSGGRADFELEAPGGGSALVEVKSCTLVEDTIAKFPDRPTERGRRHVAELIDLQAEGTDSHLVFVVQRGDGEVFTPNDEVDPEFASMVAKAEAHGVDIHAMQLSIDPPAVSLEQAAMPVELSEETG